MKLATVNPELDFNIESVFTKEVTNKINNNDSKTL